MVKYRRLIFALLAMLLLASVALTLHSRSTSSVVHYAYAGGPHSFTGQLNSGQVKAVSIDLTAQTVTVQSTSAASYTIAYPDAVLLSDLLESTSSQLPVPCC
ncbi:MAG TPA: hypothetical protein VFD50_10645 [Thermoleophilia bacterium]|nr:hypothetical protein [Thermoleophilia bacterium]